MKSLFQKYGVYLVAIILFFGISAVYFMPALKGNIIDATDDVGAWNNMSEIASHDWSSGTYGFWNGSVFSGMPNYQLGGAMYPSDVYINPIKAFFHRGAWGKRENQIWMLIFYLFSFYIVMRSFGVEKWVSILGAIAVSLSSYFIVIIATGHYGKTISLTFIPLVAAGMHLIFNKKYGIGAAMVVLFIAVAYTAHPQMTYYIFLMMGLFFLAELWIHLKEKRYKDLAIGSALFILSLTIGVGTNSASMLANMEFASETVRSGQSDLSPTYDITKHRKYRDSEGDAELNKTGFGTNGLNMDVATEWSYGIFETLSLLIPGVQGGASSMALKDDSHIYNTLVSHNSTRVSAAEFCKMAPMYWGNQQFTAGNVYVGAIICFLFILGCLIVKGPYKWALLAATLFSIMLSWGHNFLPLTSFFFTCFPFYSKFRAVSSILVVAEIAMPLLACIALSDILNGKIQKNDLRRKIFVSFVVTAGVCLVIALFGPLFCNFQGGMDSEYGKMYPDWLMSAIREQRKILMRTDCWRSILYISASAIILLLFNGHKIKKGVAVAAMIFLVFSDLWTVDHRYFNDSFFDTPGAVFKDDSLQSCEAAILQDSDPHFRVMNVTTAEPFATDSRTSRHLKSIGGATAVKLRRYQDLINVYLNNYDRKIAGMLNAKYIIYPTENGTPSFVWNDQALGNAWFVSDIVVVDNADEEMDALSTIDLANTAVIDKSFSSYVKDTHPVKSLASYINVTEYHPKSIDYRYCALADGVVVFSEIYYPYGWKAFIDGVPSDHFRANYTLRAMNVPAGVHDIHFEFDPDSVRIGSTISVVCIFLMYALLAAVAVWYAVIGVKKVYVRNK